MNYITVALSVSVVANIFLIWFCYKLFRNMLTLSDNLYRILEQVKDFALHLDSVYNMPVFFGDETLGALLSHSKDLTGDMDNFIKTHAFDLEVEAEEEVEEQDEETEIDQKAA
jgi:hypothetical protein